MRKLLLTLTLSVALAACSCTKQEKFDPVGPKAQKAVTIASNYAISHFGAPSCRDVHSNWKYSLRQDGDMLIADIGPKGAARPPIKIVMRAADLKIMNAVKA
jgi:hypothetical protein